MPLSLTRGRSLSTRLLAAGLLLVSVSLSAEADLMELSLAQLSELSITSVSKRMQALQVVPAAVAVVSAEDIQDAPAILLPELLRYVPGMQVARINAHSWAVSARGFNNALADKLEVRLDGRTLYTPLYSGVFWDQQVLDPEQIERIEVMRGPAGTLWGSNAVNGVINIVSKGAADDRGGALGLGAGQDQSLAGNLRWAGTRLGAGLSVRLFGQNIPDSEPAGASVGGDSWRYAGLSLRGDRGPWSLLAQHQRGQESGQSGDIEVEGSSLLLGRRHRGENLRGTVQLYWDGTRRQVEGGFHEQRDTVELSYEQNLRPLEAHDLVWGLGYRLSSDRTGGSDSLVFTPASRDLNLYSAYLQDQWQLGARGSLAIGSKFEHNDYTGFEYQPSLRYTWLAGPESTLWAAVSRALRMPSRLDRDARLVGAASNSPESAAEDLDGGAAGNLPDPNINASQQGCIDAGGAPPLCELLFGNGTPQSYDDCRLGGLGPRVCELLFDQVVDGDLLGNPAFRSEELLGYEFGWRQELSPEFSLDSAVYYNQYDQLRGVQPLADGNALISNELEGKSYGGELLLRWRASSSLQWLLGYGYLYLDLWPKTGSADSSSAAREGNDPRHQGSIRVLWKPGPRLRGQLALRYVDALPNQRVPAYGELDANLNWRFARHASLRLSGNNLLQASHAEFGAGQPRLVERSVLIGLRLDW